MKYHNPHSYSDIVTANKEYYCQEASSYDYKSRSNTAFRKYLVDQIKKILAKYPLDHPLSIVDVGTGTGFGISCIKEALAEQNISGTSLSGCDISPHMLKEAQKNHPDVAFNLFDGRTLPYRKVDIILFISMLHHCLDPFILLSEAKRCLKRKGAILVAQEPNPTVNCILLFLRKLLFLYPKGITALAEYHQFITSGIKPDLILDFFLNYKCRIDYTNSSLEDEFCMKFGLKNKWITSLLNKVESKYTSLNYTLVVSKSENPSSYSPPSPSRHPLNYMHSPMP